MSVYSQITQAVDWFYVHDNPRPGGAPIVYPVAVWAVHAGEEGNQQVIGLIAADLPNKDDPKPRLHQVPPVPGRYLHRTELSEAERASANLR